MPGADSFHEYVRAKLATWGRVAFLLTGDAHLSEDLVQVTLIRVASHWERISAAGDPDPYVRRVLYSQHVSWWRRTRKEAPVIDVLPDVAAADSTAGIATSLTVAKALSCLTVRQRAVLVLRYFEDKTEVETAAVLGISVGTVKSNTRDALARMRIVAPELAELEVAVR